MPAAKLDAKLQTKICTALARGHDIRAAMANAGAHRSMYYAWRERGLDARAVREEGLPVKRTELKYLHFLDATDLAIDQGEHWLVEQALQAAQEKRATWSCYVTILERTRRDRWARPSRVEHANADGKALQVSHVFDPSKLSREQLETLLQLLEQAQPEA